MIRIVHLIDSLTMSGFQETVFDYYDKVDRNKYEMYLLVASDDTQEEKLYNKKCSKDYNYVIVNNLGKQKNIWKSIKAFFYVYNFLKKNYIHIINTYKGKVAFSGRLAAKLAGVPVIVHTVNGWGFYSIILDTKNKRQIMLEKYIAKLTDKIITVTSKGSEIGVIENISNRNKFCVIRSGISLEKFNKKHDKEVVRLRKTFEGKKIVGTVSKLTKEKNIIDFIKIAKMISRKREDIHFIIIGDGEEREKLEKHIKTSQIEEFVTFLGAKTNVVDYYNIMDVFVMSSLKAGLPRVILEAMACSVPVVTNALDGISEMIKDGVNGYLIKPYDLGNVAVKVEKLIDNVELKERIVVAALDTIRSNFNVEDSMKQTMKLYEELSEQKHNKINKKDLLYKKAKEIVKKRDKKKEKNINYKRTKKQKNKKAQK